MQFVDKQPQISLSISTGWSGPSLSTYIINWYCSICQRTENAQIRLHRCACWSGPTFFCKLYKGLFRVLCIICYKNHYKWNGTLWQLQSQSTIAPDNWNGGRFEVLWPFQQCLNYTKLVLWKSACICIVLLSLTFHSYMEQCQSLNATLLFTKYSIRACDGLIILMVRKFPGQSVE